MFVKYLVVCFANVINPHRHPLRIVLSGEPNLDQPLSQLKSVLFYLLIGQIMPETQRSRKTQRQYPRYLRWKERFSKRSVMSGFYYRLAPKSFSSQNII